MPTASDRQLAMQYAHELAKCDVEAFAWLLGLQFTHDDEAGHAKALIVKALKAYAR